MVSRLHVIFSAQNRFRRAKGLIYLTPPYRMRPTYAVGISLIYLSCHGTFHQIETLQRLNSPIWLSVMMISLDGLPALCPMPIIGATLCCSQR